MIQAPEQKRRLPHCTPIAPFREEKISCPLALAAYRKSLSLIRRRMEIVDGNKVWECGAIGESFEEDGENLHVELFRHSIRVSSYYSPPDFGLAFGNKPRRTLVLLRRLTPLRWAAERFL